MLDLESYGLVAAAQLVEAAYHARNGDREAARAHIAHATALLDRDPTSLLATVRAARHKRTPRGSLPTWQARRLAAHIDANIGHRIYLTDLAGFLSLSVSHFCRVFKHTFAMSARAWITRRRIEVAQALMLSTRDPLSEIALRCGMSDQSHFTRSFRLIVGETPRRWRESRRVAVEEPAGVRAGHGFLPRRSASPGDSPPPALRARLRA